MIYLLLFLLFMPLSFAFDSGFVGENTTVWCSIIQDGLPLSVSYANITILDPQNNIYINNVNTTFIQTGLYKYIFIANQTGNYLAYCNFYNTTTLVGQAKESIFIKGETGNMELAILFGLIALGAFIIYLSKDIVNKPQGDITKSVFKVFDVKNVAVFLHLAATWVLVGIVGFISIISQTKAYAPMMDNIYIAVAFGVAGFNLIYLSIYIIYLIKLRMETYRRV